jgi:WD40 repeat protein
VESRSDRWHSGAARALSVATICVLAIVVVGSLLAWFHGLSPTTCATHVKYRLLGDGGAVHSVAFSPDSRLLATGGDDTKIRIWDLSTGDQLRVLTGHTSAVHGLSFSHDGRALASASFDGTVRVWSLQAGCITGVLKQATNFWSVAFSPDDTTIATGGFDGTVRLWKWKKGADRPDASLKVDSSWVYSLAFSGEGNYLATASGGGLVKLYDLTSNQACQTYRVPFPSDGVWSVALAADGRRVAAASGSFFTRGEVTVWTIGSGAPPVVRTEALPVLAVSFSPDDMLLAAAGQDCALNIYDARSLQKAVSSKCHSEPITAIAFSPDGKLLASASYDGSAIIWVLKELGAAPR